MHSAVPSYPKPPRLKPISGGPAASLLSRILGTRASPLSCILWDTRFAVIREGGLAWVPRPADACPFRQSIPACFVVKLDTRGSNRPYPGKRFGLSWDTEGKLIRAYSVPI